MCLLELSCRRRQLCEMLDLISYLRREISCSCAPLHQIFSNESCPKNLPLLRQMDFREPFDLAESYGTAKNKTAGEMFFSDSDWTACDALFTSLGFGDLSEQERRLSRGEIQFSEAEKSVRELTRTKGRPALVLGCSAGIVLVLMLV